jgi:mono/diheme cytochrome c family protein
VTEFPAQVVINRETLLRGQQRYNIYCSVCHGYAGQGDGLVNQRAMALAATGNAQWTSAKSYHDPEVKKQPVGRIFDTITNGRNTMGPYASQIPVMDRWAIVAYVRALQATGILPPVPVASADTTADSQSAKEPGRP